MRTRDKLRLREKEIRRIVTEHKERRRLEHLRLRKQEWERITAAPAGAR